MAKSSEKPTAFSLQGKVPRITQLNRTAILLISGVVLVVLLVILFSAFSSSGAQDTQNAESATLKSSDQKNSTEPTQISALPSSYGEADAIDKILNRNQPQEQSQAASPQVLAQLASLQAQQVQLQSQLAMMRSQQAAPPLPVQTYQPPASPLDQEAMTSAIFFSGGAPVPPPQPIKATEVTKKASATSGKSSTDGSTPYEKQNMQAEKLSFLNTKPSTAIYNKNHIQYPGSKYILQAGTTIPAILKTKLESTNPGYIVAIVTQNVYDSLDGQYLIIPKGSTLMGEYSSQVAFGQDSLQAKFTRLIRPDGTSIVLPNEVGGDPEGVSGLTDQLNNHWGAIIGAATLAAVFNIPSIVATNQQNNSNAYNPTTGYPTTSVGSTASASAMQSLGQTASQVGGQLTQRSLNLQPTITIRAGYQFSVMVTKDIILPPYQMPLNESVPETSSG